MITTLIETLLEWVFGKQLSATVLLARVVDATGALLTQAACTAITYKVVDIDDNRNIIQSGSLTIANVIFDAAQTDDIWPYSDGYNFKWALPAAYLPEPRRYVVEIEVDPVAGEDFWWSHPLNCQRKQSET